MRRVVGAWAVNAEAGAEAKGRLWLAELLWRLGGVQFGDFTVGRTVRNSPVYVNPKLLIARPDALAHAALLLAEELQLALAMRNRPVEPFDLIAGVPIGGLHVATALSLQMRVPLLYARPDTPEDERPQIEGIYRPGQTALIVDDLATGGGSLVATVERLRRAGLYVRDCAVLITREQGARARLEALGVRLHPLLSVEVLLTYLHEADRIPAEDFRRALQYLRREGDARPPLP